MFFVHQHKDDNDNDIKDIVTTITSFKDINIKDIQDTDYLLIDLHGTIIDKLSIKNYLSKMNIKSDANHIFLEKLNTKLNESHKNDCRFLANIDIKTKKIHYITEHDINKTLSKFKKQITNLRIYALSRGKPGKLINNVYSNEDQLAKLGINVINKYIWTNNINKGIFLFGWDKSLNEYCEYCYNLNKYCRCNLDNTKINSKTGYFDLHPEMIGKNIVIVDNDINQLNYIYNAYKQKYSKHIDKLKLYLYKNPFVLQMEAGNEESALTAMEQEYCDCKPNYNQGENQKNKIKAQATTKGEQNVT